MRFSIIVPVYNIEKYLEECINSVLNQAYDDYELILVDDGSTDNSGKLCDKYAMDNTQIHIIHKVNEGLSAARNCGIRAAKGEYIIFLDGDDYWESNTMLLEVSAYIAKYKSDIVVFEGKKFWDNKNKRIFGKRNVNKLYSQRNYSFEDFIKTYLNRRTIWNWYSCFYVIRKKIFVNSNLRFPRQRKYEDVYLMWRILMQAEKIGTISKPYYMYRQGREGAITNVKSYTNIEDFIWIIEKNINDLKCMGVEESVKRLLMANFSYGYLGCCVLASRLQKQERKKCFKELEKKRYLLQYFILPRYRYCASLSKVLGIKNVACILSFRDRLRSTVIVLGKGKRAGKLLGMSKNRQ